MKSAKLPKPPQRAWDRAQLTLRLSEARKEQLQELAKREGISGGPAKVVDRALDLALRGEATAMCARELAELSTEIATGSEEAERRCMGLERRLEELVSAVDALARTIVSVASEEG